MKISDVVLSSSLTATVQTQGELALGASSYSGSENLFIQFSIVRTEEVNERVSVDWAITNASVTPSSGTETFEIGETVQALSVLAGEVAPSEVGQLTLSNPQNLSGGTTPALINPMTATFTVNDLDAWLYVGVPDPANNFGYDPLNIPIPDDPGAWPSSEVAGFYYVDNSDGSATDSNAYGYPNVPRLTPPTTVAAGAVVKFGGGIYNAGYTPLCNGTQANPIFIDGQSAATMRGDFVCASGSNHAICDGFLFDQDDIGFHIQNGSQYITMRNFTMNGTGTDVGNESVTGLSGQFMVCYNNEMGNYGAWQGPAENDYHGFRPAQNGTDMWILNNHVHHLGGDSIQVGIQNISPVSARPTRVYIAGNDFHDNFENAIDIKDSDTVICSGNECYNMVTSEINVAHNNCTNVSWINNIIHDGLVGVLTSNGIGHWFFGNVFYNMVGGLSPFNDANVAIACRSANDVYIHNNTFFNNHQHIEMASSMNLDTQITNNIFGTRQSPSTGYDINFASGSDAGTVDRNLYQDLRVLLSGTYTSLAAFQGTGREANGVEGDPLFVDTGADNYRVTASSPAKNAGNESSEWNNWETDFGLNIKTDIDGTTRPDGSWEIGAYEQV